MWNGVSWATSAGLATSPDILAEHTAMFCSWGHCCEAHRGLVFVDAASLHQVRQAGIERSFTNIWHKSGKNCYEHHGITPRRVSWASRSRHPTTVRLYVACIQQHFFAAAFTVWACQGFAWNDAKFWDICSSIFRLWDWQLEKSTNSSSSFFSLLVVFHVETFDARAQATSQACCRSCRFWVIAIPERFYWRLGTFLLCIFKLTTWLWKMPLRFHNGKSHFMTSVMCTSKDNIEWSSMKVCLTRCMLSRCFTSLLTCNCGLQVPRWIKKQNFNGLIASSCSLWCGLWVAQQTLRDARSSMRSSMSWHLVGSQMGTRMLWQICLLAWQSLSCPMTRGPQSMILCLTKHLAIGSHGQKESQNWIFLLVPSFQILLFLQRTLQGKNWHPFCFPLCTDICGKRIIIMHQILCHSIFNTPQCRQCVMETFSLAGLSLPTVVSWLVHVCRCLVDCRYTFLLDIALNHNQPMLMVGPTGTGKSVYINRYLVRDLPEDSWMPIFITFSARTSANMTQEQVDGRLDKRRKGVFGPRVGKKCVIFVDDLNMPAKETYGAQPPVEILRQYMDYSGWYGRDNSFHHLVDVQFVCAMGLPGGGRTYITNRYLRHFNTLALSQVWWAVRYT